MESRFSPAGIENLFTNMFLLDGKIASIDKNIKKHQRKWFTITVIRILNRLLHDLNNGFN